MWFCEKGFRKLKHILRIAILQRHLFLWLENSDLRQQVVSTSNAAYINDVSMYAQVFISVFLQYFFALLILRSLEQENVVQRIYRSRNISPRSSVQGHVKPDTGLIFWARTFCLGKKKKILNLQVFGWTGKTMKKLQWVPDTVIKTNTFW